ncbi:MULTISPECIES: CHASE2 domain-containing protein [Pseudanabaena]|uniref:CHASE2 domain-containing protein n=1 Tax=Pseudanabaena TaxID=1152 RepID=UPI002478FDC3|nr:MULTISPECIES: CHASE2 domain-containing protein [Pseudanabaena]MEA5485931.1 CHASE2 domain-containing protein [Pseudanabaena sp. CCNP1317]WGS71349.1 CHASE2 domain-containing protein [Pseudanabaena galeata CCNP1313]
MKKDQRDAFFKAMKAWLFPPQPKPQIFLNLLTTGDDFLSPQKIKVSLQVERLEIALTSANITEKLASDFREWNLNYPSYAIWKEVFDLLNILILFIGNDFPNLFYHLPQQINSDKDNISIYSFYYRLILLVCKVEVGRYIDTGAFRKPQKTVGEQSSGSRTEHIIEDAGERVKRSINDLFDSKDFKEVREQLIKLLPSEDQPQPDVYIRYDDPMLAMLPLHLWDEFQSRNIEPVFCSLKTSIQNKSFKKKQKPRILLILGDFVDIKNENEKLNWQIFYPDAEIKVLEMLNAKGISDALWKEKWDVLYFGGHSTTQERKGILYLKDDVSITLGDFRKGLARAAKNGLQLAIFNSCISLGAAADLQNAGIPMVIATRHLMHNLIAPEFLELFLDAYINDDRSIKEAVWYARERLKTDSNYFPCADFLPVVFQIPTATIQPKASPLVAIVTSFFVTCLVFFLHTQGIFQAAELSLYDHMMDIRKPAQVDRDIVVVRVTPEDEEMQIREGENLEGNSISDKYLVKLLDKLDQEKPKVIGMTFMRLNLKSDSYDNKKLVSRMLNDVEPRLVAICAMGIPGSERDYFPQPMDKKNPTNQTVINPEYRDPRVGFSNSYPDVNYSERIRRLMLVKITTKDACGEQAIKSFALRLVLNHLDISDKDVMIKAPKNRVFLEYKGIKIENIIEQQGGYQIDPSLSVNPNSKDLPKNLSILFNYKNYKNKIDVVEFSLESILSGRHTSLKDKVVIIGGTDKDNVALNNLGYHVLSTDYLLRIFRGGDHVLIGSENNLTFLICLLNTLGVTYIITDLFINCNYNRFLLILSAFAFHATLIFWIHFITLISMSLWIPSVPTYISSTLSCIILIIYLQYSNYKPTHQ